MWLNVIRLILREGGFMSEHSLYRTNRGVVLSAKADYWVSQGRKYCDFCKCWITDNKPSIEFHEKGRRHQENVKKKLRNITRHSSQAQRNTDKIDVTLRQMESAALESYKKDMETNADLSSTAMRQHMQGGGGRVTKLWNEQKTRDGKTFYVNIMTKETIWRRPLEGFLSIEEQRQQAQEEAHKQFKALEKYKKKEAIMTMHKVQQEEAEAAARKAREELKKYRVAEDLTPTTCGPLLEPGRTDPYGRWQVVKESQPVDLQLPEPAFYYDPPVEYEPEPVIEFKEKTVETLNEGEGECLGIGFKKRKIRGGAQRNTRQRLDID